MLHIGQPTTISIGGECYQLSRYTRRVLRDLIEWCVSVLPDPLTYAKGKLDGLPLCVQATLFTGLTERRRLRRSAYNPVILDLWQSLEGRVTELWLLLGKTRAKDTCGELYEAAALEHGNNYLPSRFLDCMGRMPKDESEADRELLQEWGLLPKPPELKPNNEPEDWLAIDKALIKHFNLRPWEIEELTPTEIMVLFATLKDDNEHENQQAKDRLLPGVYDPKRGNAREQALAYSRLTPAQKLLLIDLTTR